MKSPFREVKATARIVNAFNITGRGDFIAIDGLEGVVSAGQRLVVLTDQGELGPDHIRAVEFALVSASTGIEQVALGLSARQKDGLEACHGCHGCTVEVFDSPYPLSLASDQTRRTE